MAFYRDAKGPSGGGTHNGEPPLGLHMATSEVASDYKKKKNVFKLRWGGGHTEEGGGIWGGGAMG